MWSNFHLISRSSDYLVKMLNRFWSIFLDFLLYLKCQAERFPLKLYILDAFLMKHFNQNSQRFYN